MHSLVSSWDPSKIFFMSMYISKSRRRWLRGFLVNMDYIKDHQLTTHKTYLGPPQYLKKYSGLYGFQNCLKLLVAII